MGKREYANFLAGFLFGIYIHTRSRILSNEDGRQPWNVTIASKELRNANFHSLPYFLGYGFPIENYSCSIHT
jgi:hypothetical protein